MQWDIFISHASEDKEAVAKPLFELLAAAGARVWLDIGELKLGDSLSQRIDEGLANSSYGVVVLSRSFFAKQWPKRELAALVQKELQGRKVILPIWHGVDHDYVMQFSPTLADKLAVSTDQGIEQVASRIMQILREARPGASPEGAPLQPQRQPGPKGPRPISKASRLRKPTPRLLNEIFLLLSRHYPDQNWWIRDNKFQICVEAILTQGTGWKNVGIAIANLESKCPLTPDSIHDLSESELRQLIRPCGRTVEKAAYIKGFAKFLREHYESSIDKFLAQDTLKLRRELLALKGVGEFTCDNILLYGADRPTLPINQRLQKVLGEHDFLNENDSYALAQQRLAGSLVQLTPHKIRELDAMIYKVAHEYCLSPPRCEGCPLTPLLPRNGPRSMRRHGHQAR